MQLREPAITWPFRSVVSEEQKRWPDLTLYIKDVYTLFMKNGAINIKLFCYFFNIPLNYNVGTKAVLASGV